jgi:hypothetical protein
LESAVALANEVGAMEAAPEAFRVTIDPDGHPFCLCPSVTGS